MNKNQLERLRVELFAVYRAICSHLLLGASFNSFYSDLSYTIIFHGCYVFDLQKDHFKINMIKFIHLHFNFFRSIIS